MGFNIDSVKFNIIAAFDKNRGIGVKGKIPWDIPREMRYFKKITTETWNSHKENVVIMGRKTWESIPENFRPLKGRKNIVISRNRVVSPEEVLRANSLEGAIWMASLFRSSVESLFIIGGGSIYSQAIDLPGCNRIFATEIRESYVCDTFFPVFLDRFRFKETIYMSRDPLYLNNLYERLE